MHRLLPMITACALVCSCRSLTRQAPPPVPVRYSVEQGPLLVYSDFPLPDDSPLLAELKQLEKDMSYVLATERQAETISIYLFDSDDAYRQFIAEHFPDLPYRRAFFLKANGLLAVYAHRGPHLREDLRHEVAHGYLHANFDALPLWLDEGLAEFFEVPRSAGGLHSEHLQLLASLEHDKDWRPDLVRLEKLAALAEMNHQDYAESWAWVHWLLAADDRRALVQRYLHQQGARQPLSEFIEADWRLCTQALQRHLKTAANQIQAARERESVE